MYYIIHRLLYNHLLSNNHAKVVRISMGLGHTLTNKINYGGNVSLVIDRNKFRSTDKLEGAPFLITKSDTDLGDNNGFYPRGIEVLTGGTITVWVDVDNVATKRDLVEVYSGWRWIYGGILGVALTNEADGATTCDNIIGIP